MRTVSIEDARTGLEEILDYAEATRQPVRIDGADGSAVLVSAAQWRSIQETLFLLAVPGMRDSILDGQLSSVDECSHSLDW